jgi:NAD(P)-dependent dehydrogenase (short-subunit alcohol dehydrogenase family)
LIETKLQANVLSQVVMIKAVLPYGRGGRGRIVNVTSAVAITDPPAPSQARGMGLGVRDVEKGAPTASPGSSRWSTARSIEIFNGARLRGHRAHGGERQGDRARGAVPAYRRRCRRGIAQCRRPTRERNGQTLSAQKFAKEQ